VVDRLVPGALSARERAWDLEKGKRIAARGGEHPFGNGGCELVAGTHLEQRARGRGVESGDAKLLRVREVAGGLRGDEQCDPVGLEALREEGDRIRGCIVEQ